MSEPEQLDLVVVGHVDHGKSTVIGRLLADTGSLPVGKLAQVRERCARSSRPFEYAFLLDALKNEQAQGITIDAARCFFKTPKRRYIITDAPGHVEFLKNMVTGASRAEAALLVIDAQEGIRENSKRHGYILSLLGLSQLAVLVNKMDLVGYDRAVFERVRDEYSAFLAELGVAAVSMIPIAARTGGNLARRAPEMPWYQGRTVLEQVDDFRVDRSDAARPFRMPLQDVYKFTELGDNRRIFAGSIASGRIAVGTRIRFLPSRKTSTVASIEAFSAPACESAEAGQAVGLTLAEQIYVRPGELMVAEDDTSALATTRIRATVFWMGHAPFVQNQRYLLKLGAARVAVELREIRRVIDATALTADSHKPQLERHDVGEVVLESLRPVACDVSSHLQATARFVLVDRYDIAGCGVVLGAVAGSESLLDRRVRARDFAWQSGVVTRQARTQRYGHQGKFILVAVGAGSDPATVAFAERLAGCLEAELFEANRRTYYLAMGNLERGTADRDDHVQRLGEMARVLTDAGLLFLSVLSDAEDPELSVLRALNRPAELFVVRVGPAFGPEGVELVVDPATDVATAARQVLDRLGAEEVLLDYVI